MKIKIPKKLTFIMFCAVIIFMAFYVLNANSKHHTMQTKQADLKYILRWKSLITFRPLGVGNQGFVERNCSFTNCFITPDRNLLNDYTEFDVIAFDGPQIANYKQYQLPKKRSPHQKYVFASLESAANYPIHNDYFDDFFNWTWTYKLDSDFVWGYITIEDVEGKTVGPAKKIPWMKLEEMAPVSEELRKVLRRKTRAAAWLVSNCHTLSKREEYVANLDEVLRTRYNLSVDIYGRCGELMCKDCDAMIKNDYFFYLAFENSFSEDYVTEKLSRALECNAVPIVYGGADYSRFLSNGSYLNARELGVDKLAARMNELMNDFEQYADHFRWTNNYRYRRRSDYCDMCAMLNNEGQVNNVSVYKNFREWWNEPNCARKTTSHYIPCGYKLVAIIFINIYLKSNISF